MLLRRHRLTRVPSAALAALLLVLAVLAPAVHACCVGSHGGVATDCGGALPEGSDDDASSACACASCGTVLGTCTRVCPLQTSAVGRLEFLDSTFTLGSFSPEIFRPPLV